MSEIICGIYKIINLVNGKVYIGQSQNIEHRWQEHRRNMYRKKYQNIVLYKALKKYGIDNFSFIVLEECALEELDAKEIQYIESFRSYIGFDDCNGYNMTLGGIGNHGAIRTKEWNDKISNSQKGKIPWNLGKRYENPKLKGRFCGENNPFYGHKHSKEAVDKMREKATGRPSSNRKIVICADKIFNSIAECATFYNISEGVMSAWLTGRRGMPQKFYDLGLNTIPSSDCIYIAKPARGIKNGSSKPVVCLNTGKVYETITLANIDTGANINSIIAVCKGKRNFAGKDEYKNKLKWQYYEEYLKGGENECEKT